MFSNGLIKITPIKSLIGHDNEQFLLLGMLTQIEEGKLFLEDNDAYVELDISRCVSHLNIISLFDLLTYLNSLQKSTIGLFTDNCFILVEGVYGDDHIFHVDELGLPPPENRAKTT
jgi:DNA polymerase epsilon subunit 2